MIHGGLSGIVGGDVWRVGMGKDRYAYIFFCICNEKAYIIDGIRFISLVLTSKL